ncbi:helix-turn-helix transcriptional regulator [Microbacterium sp. ISL-59]|uniref:helix-turn-helix domain-containing protein n=1 Tax=Microbacterium sp. ISL-59 TaxID=2819159 RepID=UPI001BEA6D6A|nr:helix-turn-helix transcriptional regulator [Microbacterium sp. ISL-59]
MWGQEAAIRLGAVVREHRIDRGISQEMLARGVGISKNQMQLIEAGRSAGAKDDARPSNPQMSTLSGIAHVLEVSVAQLMTESGL